MSTNGVDVLPQSGTSVQLPSALPPFSVADIRKRTRAIQEVMKGVMKEGTHYGTIPGTPKPSLWKAGAEVLCMTFRLAPILESRVVGDEPEAEWTYTATKRDGSTVSGCCIGFFEVEATCTVQGLTGEVLSRCSARCNNREGKYRSANAFDIRNTILKMAEKRAFVSAALMATGASDLFTQDIEDLPESLGKPIAPFPTPNGVQSQENTAGSPDSERRPIQRARCLQTNSLSPKRAAWLSKVAQESNVAPEAVERCMAFLRSAEPVIVTAFFDDLARRKCDVFKKFSSG